MSSASIGVPQSFPLEVRRTALLERMRRMGECTVYAALAPSGYGKTTLLAQFARTSRRRCVWITLGTSDTHPLHLARRLGAALGDLNLALTDAHAFNDAASLPEALAHILAENLNACGENLLLFFDGLEHLSKESGQWLERFILDLEEGHQVLLSGYEAGVLPLGRWAARGEALLLGVSDLAFSAGEAQAFLERSGYAGDPAQLCTALEGWAGGLALVASGGTVGYSALDLLEERFVELPEALTRALPSLTVWEVWTERLPQWLQVSLPAGWLSTLIACGLPLTPLGEGRYQPHSSLRDMLSVQLAQHPRREAALHRRAGEAAEQAGDWSRALLHFQRARATPAALRMVAQGMPDLLRHSEYGLLAAQLESFDERVLTPQLCVTLAGCRLELGQAQQGEALLKRVQASGFEDWELHRWQAYAAYHRGQPSQMLEHVRMARTLPHDSRQAVLLWHLECTAHRELGQIEAARTDAEQALEGARALGQELLIAKAEVLLADACGDLGDFAEAERLYQHALLLYTQLHIEGRKLEIYHNYACLCADQNRLADAMTLIDRGLSQYADPLRRWRAYLLGLRASVWAQQADYTHALEDARSAETLCLELGLVHHGFEFALAQVDYLCMLRRPQEARDQLRRVDAHPVEMTPRKTAQRAFSEALLAFCEGRNEDALRQLRWADTELLGFCERPQIPLFRAALCAVKGEDVTPDLNEAWVHLERLGHLAPLHMSVPLLEAFYQQHPRAHRIRAALAQPLSHAASSRGVVLKIKTLGGFSAVLNGDSIEVGLSKAQELLVYLALHGPVSRDVLVTALWNGSRRREDVDYFKVAVRRLRAALSAHHDVDFDPLPYEDRRYQLHTRLDVSCDALTLLERPSLHSPPELGKLLARSTKLFLAQHDTPWVEEVRRHQTEVALEHALACGHALVDSWPAQAREAYAWALELDPLNERAQTALTHLHRQG